LSAGLSGSLRRSFRTPEEHWRQDVDAPRVLLEPLSHLLEQRITSRPADLVIELLKPLQIDQ
jgi:hypothetical protein